jgi:hypothetical protein
MEHAKKPDLCSQMQAVILQSRNRAETHAHSTI